MPLDSWRNFDDCIEAVTTDLYKEAIDMGLPASLPLATAYLLSVIYPLFPAIFHRDSRLTSQVLCWSFFA